MTMTITVTSNDNRPVDVFAHDPAEDTEGETTATLLARVPAGASQYFHIDAPRHLTIVEGEPEPVEAEAEDVQPEPPEPPEPAEPEDEPEDEADEDAA